MENNKTTTKKMPVVILLVCISILLGCQRSGESIIVGTWKICGSTLGGQELVCGSVDGDKLTFSAYGVIKAKNSIYNNDSYRLEGDSALYITMPGGETLYRVEFSNNNNNMIIYDWIDAGSGSAISIVYDICLKKIK